MDYLKGLSARIKMCLVERQGVKEKLLNLRSELHNALEKLEEQEEQLGRAVEAIQELNIVLLNVS